MALSRDVVIRLLGDASSAEKAIKSAADAAEVSVSAYRRAEREMAKQQRTEQAALQARRQAMQEAGQTALILGGAMLAGFGIAAKAAMDFDKAMSGVAAASGATGDQLDRLREAALEAGRTTAYSATEAAQAETELAKAGVSVADILGGGLKGALDLAAAGQMEVAAAAEIAATALKVFGLSGEDMSHVADLLAAGAGKAQGSVDDMSQALNQSALIAKNTGLSIEDTTGALALFASNGLLGSDAGTSFKTMLMSLNPRSQEAAKLMDDLGLRAYDAQGNFVGLSEYAGTLKDRLSGMSQEQRNSALQTIFGNDAIRAATLLYQAGSAGVDEWRRSVNDAGYAEEQAAKLTDNLAGDLERLGGAITDVLIGGGSKATGVLRWLVQGITDAVGAVGNLPGPLQAVGMGFVGVVGAGTAMLGLVGTMIPRIHEARESLRGLGTMGATVDRGVGAFGRLAGRATIAGAALGALGALASAVEKDFEVTEVEADKLTDSLLKLGETGKASGEVAQLFGSNLSGLAGDMAMLSPLLHGAGNDFLGLADDVKSAGLSTSYFSPAAHQLEDNLRGLQLEFDQARENIEATDEALAGLVGSGKAEGAANAIMRLYDAWVQAGGEVGAFRDQFPEAVGALEDYAAASDTVVTNTGEVETAMGEAAVASDILKTAFEELNGVALSNAEAHVRWTQAVNSFTVAAEDGSKSLDLNTLSGAQNAEQFIRATEIANTFAQTVADTSGLEAGRAKLDELRTSLLDQAEAAGFDRGTVEDLITSIFRVPADTQTAIDLHDNATPGIDAVTGALNTINGKTATVYVRTVTTEVVSRILNANPVRDVGGGGNPIGLPPVRRATGGPVWPGQTFMVGEEGPELVRFGGTGHVTSAAQTARALSTGTGIPVGAGARIPGGTSARGDSPTQVHVTVSGAQVTGTMVVDGDGIAHLVDGRIVAAFVEVDNRGRYNP